MHALARPFSVAVALAVALAGCLTSPEAERPPTGSETAPEEPAPVPLAVYMTESYHSPRHGVNLMPNTTGDVPAPAYCVAYVDGAWDGTTCVVDASPRQMEVPEGAEPRKAPWTLRATWHDRARPNETVVAFDSLGASVASWDGAATWWIVMHVTE